MMLAYWTVPYVAIDDWRLKFSYTLGVCAVVLYLFAHLFVHRSYLEKDLVSGMSRLRLKSPDLSHFEQPENGDKFVLWDSDEVTTYLENGLFIATRIKDINGELHCPDGEQLTCRSYDVRSKHEFFPKFLEQFTLSLRDRVEALTFCKEFRANHPGSSYCPFSYDTNKLHGRLLGHDGKVIAALPSKGAGAKKDSDELTLSSWLHAAGVRLDEMNVNNRTLREKGVTLLVLVHYDHDDSVGFWNSFWERQSLPMKYSIRVLRLSDAGYKRREVIGHQGTTRVTRCSWGISIKVVSSGHAHRWSFSALLDMVVIQLGLLSLLTQVLDFFWQHVLPRFGHDYNDAVFREIKLKRN
eukprot:GEMP01018820.1.p1 GENE.GEMP01018820.1~~GEMP01018820.1.p1  ORF type:complete len:353 (+),score=63.02 GEMP01018820.1:222-1280(+)